MGESIIIKEKRSKVLLFNNLQWQHCSQVKNGCIVICPYVCQSKAHHKTNLLEPLVRFPGIAVVSNVKIVFLFLESRFGRKW